MKYFLIFIIFNLSFVDLAFGNKRAHSLRKRPLATALHNIETGDYINGSKQLYYLSRLKSYKSRRVQIKYTLGIAFTEMKLYHMASLQFLYVVKRNNRTYKTKALKKIIELMDYLEDKNIFYYITSTLSLRDFPVTERGVFYFYQGLSRFKKRQFNSSRRYFSKVQKGAKFYNKAQYYTALSYAEENKALSAAKIFRDLSLRRRGVTDSVRVAALMGWARSLYQAKKFKRAVQIYRLVPRDTKFWHDTLLESSWAYLRSAKFRSALSNFQTLHSSFYNDHYQPESLILRSYVYLYICKYYEMEKVLDLFNTIYLPTLKKVERQLRSGTRYTAYFNAVISSKDQARNLIPPVLINHLMKNTEFAKHLNYLEKLKEEQSRVASLPGHWRQDRVGRNTSYMLRTRSASIKKQAGKLVKEVLSDVRKDLKRISLSEQYLRYDMLRGKREAVKKRIAGRYVDNMQIDEKISRSYYIKNGYEYWPFQGENWLDELGNYHYIGLHDCQ